MNEQVKCSLCQGTGNISSQMFGNQTCTECMGSGKVMAGKIVRICENCMFDNACSISGEGKAATCPNFIPSVESVKRSKEMTTEKSEKEGVELYVGDINSDKCQKHGDTLLSACCPSCLKELIQSAREEFARELIEDMKNVTIRKEEDGSIPLYSEPLRELLISMLKTVIKQKSGV